MTWSILTPYRTVHWDGTDLHFTQGASKADIPDDDRLEAYWRAYYSSIFNPARLKIGAMQSEMPKKYWRNLPEAAAIPDLIRTAQSRTATMIETPSFSPPKPARAPAKAPAIIASAEPGSTTLAQARQDIHACRRCELWQPATQPVFGEGPPDARLMFVGEQPGDQEDLAGRPFIGPAGQMFDRAIAEAGIDRSTVYVTNAVKHFKFIPRGKRRIHEKPGTSEITACKLLARTRTRRDRPRRHRHAGRHGRPRRARSHRHHRQANAAAPSRSKATRIGFVTVHPSYLLRIPDEEAKAREYTAFVQDLKRVAVLVG